MDFWSTVQGSRLADALIKYCNQETSETKRVKQYTATVQVMTPAHGETNLRVSGFSDSGIPIIHSESLASALAAIQRRGGKVTLIQKLSPSSFVVLYEADVNLYPVP